MEVAVMFVGFNHPYLRKKGPLDASIEDEEDDDNIDEGNEENVLHILLTFILNEGNFKLQVIKALSLYPRNAVSFRSITVLTLVFLL